MINMVIKTKYKDSIGLGIIEIILAVAIMMIITPAVLKYSFKELYEVKYINIAKQLKQIEKSLLNYAAIEKQNWANGASGSITKDVSDLLISDYGLNNDISPDIIENMRIKYLKNSDGAVEVFAVLDLDKLGLDEMQFKQTLLYAGDSFGFKDENYAYSITGAWSEPFVNISGNVSAENVVVIKIDDTNLENEYSSSNYLYRNNQGGEEGNKMKVNFSLGGYNINNFGTISVAHLNSSTNTNNRVSQIKFNNGNFAGHTDIISTLILTNTAVISFATGVHIITPKVEISYLNKDSFSVLKELITKSAKLQNASSSGALSFRANIIVDGLSTLHNLNVQNMQLSNLGAGASSSTPLTISPFNDNQVRMEIATSNIDDLYAQTITVKNGHIMTDNGNFHTSGGVFYLKNGFSGVVIHDGCSTPTSKLNPNGCNGKILNKINLGNFIYNYQEALKDLDNKISAK